MKHIYIFVLLSFIAISSCSEKQSQQKMLQQAVKIEAADECHLCGMIITNFAGPKGELFQSNMSKEQSQSAKKFCSTRDMFSYYLDPENQRNITTILVHDMSKMPWDKLDDNFFIDAKIAWYVAGSNQTGAMGKTLASFSKQVDAQAFTEEFGGTVITFDEITHDLLR